MLQGRAKKSALVWLIDLDNTLHNASHRIFPAMHDNMNSLIAQVLKQEEKSHDIQSANSLRVEYWRRYGATLLGMMKHHAVCADDFLRDAHCFDNLPEMILAERGLFKLLNTLPGKKILFSNAPHAYSREVLHHLGLRRCFAKHVSIESMRVHRQLKPKPSKLMLRKLLARERIYAKNCILIEDTLSALKSAKAIGMRTVWVTQYGLPLGNGRHAHRLMYVDVKIKSVRQLLRKQNYFC